MYVFLKEKFIFMFQVVQATKTFKKNLNWLDTMFHTEQHTSLPVSPGRDGKKKD